MPKRTRARDHSVYVIELDRGVLKRKRFREKNPHYKGEMACLYVGMTVRSPEQRFEQHKKGYRSARFVRDFGLWLRPRLFKRYNPMTRAQAEKKERELAQRFREKGYAVWQN